MTVNVGTTVTTPALPPAAGSASADAAPADDQATLAPLVATLTTLLQALVAKQNFLTGGVGAGGVLGGGSGAAFVDPGYSSGGTGDKGFTIEGSPFSSTTGSTVGGAVGGGGMGAGANGIGSSYTGYTVEGSPFGSGDGGVVGGGASGGAAQIGTANTGYSVEGSPYGAAQPASTSPAATVAGGGPAAASSGPSSPTTTPQIDYGQILGTPTPGGVLDTIIKKASPMAMQEMSPGVWITLTDSGGAEMHVHAHGIYSQRPDLIPSAIASGKIQVHLHTDGTLHLHDVMPA